MNSNYMNYMMYMYVSIYLHVHVTCIFCFPIIDTVLLLNYYHNIIIMIPFTAYKYAVTTTTQTVLTRQQGRSQPMNNGVAGAQKSGGGGLRRFCIQPRFSIAQNNNLVKIGMARATLRHTLATPLPVVYCQYYWKCYAIVNICQP